MQQMLPKKNNTYVLRWLGEKTGMERNCTYIFLFFFATFSFTYMEIKRFEIPISIWLFGGGDGVLLGSCSDPLLVKLSLGCMQCAHALHNFYGFSSKGETNIIHGLLPFPSIQSDQRWVGIAIWIREKYKKCWLIRNV